MAYAIRDDQLGVEGWMSSAVSWMTGVRLAYANVETPCGRFIVT